MVADRLRTTNQKISGEIAKSIKMASALIQEISTSGNLGMTQQELQDAGSHIVSGMTDILKKLLVMKQSGEAVSHEDISRLADRAKEIYYSEFQVFENVHKQLKVLGQHLDNVSRVLSQQEMLEGRGRPGIVRSFLSYFARESPAAHLTDAGISRPRLYRWRMIWPSCITSCSASASRNSSWCRLSH